VIESGSSDLEAPLEMTDGPGSRYNTIDFFKVFPFSPMSFLSNISLKDLII